MNRQFRRRVQREWDKIKVADAKACTKFVERNDLFTLPYVIEFQAVKVADNLMCVYNVSIFGFRENLGYAINVTVCHFVDSLFRELCSINLGFVSEKHFDEGDELDD